MVKLDHLRSGKTFEELDEDLSSQVPGLKTYLTCFLLKKQF